MRLVGEDAYHQEIASACARTQTRQPEQPWNAGPHHLVHVTITKRMASQQTTHLKPTYPHNH